MREDILCIWKEEDMARIEGITRSRSLLVRLVFFFSRRCYGRVITPARVYALHPRLLLAVGHMEEAQEGARQLGASVKQLGALPDYEHSSLFSEEERVVLRYADAMTTIPVQVPEAVFTALKAIYSDRQILEVTTAIAWENYHARVNHALGLEAEGMARHICLVPMNVELRDQPAHTDALSQVRETVEQRKDRSSTKEVDPCHKQPGY